MKTIIDVWIYINFIFQYYTP